MVWPHLVGPGLIGPRLVGLLLVGLLLVLLPLAVLVVSPPSPVGRVSPVSPWSGLTDPHFRGLLGASLRLAFTVTAASLVLGLVFGLWLARTRSWAASPLLVAHLLPLCMPPYVTALAWSRVLGREGILARLGGDALGLWTSGWFYGEAGAVLVLTVALAPVITLLTAGFARRLDPSRVEAGLLYGGPRGALLSVVLPMVAPAVAAGALLVFVLVMGEVGVPQLLRVRVYAPAVFGRLADLSFQPGEALALALPMVSVSLVAAVALLSLDVGGGARAGESAGEDGGAGAGGRGLRAPRSTRWPRSAVLDLAVGLVIAGVVAAAALPLVALLRQAWAGAGGGIRALQSSLPALGNSISYACLAASAMALLAAPLGVGWSWRPRASGLLALPLLLGLVLPAGIFALALVATWNRPATQWVYGTDLVVTLALSGRYLYLAVRVVKLGEDQTPADWIDAGRLLGGHPLRRWLLVDLPLRAETLALAWLVSFLLALRDLDTIVLLYPPGGESLPVRAMTLEANAPPGMTAATAALQVLITLAIVLLAGALWRRVGRRWRT